jgi:uncharacterized protein YpuA (DUF1002 family)
MKLNKIGSLSFGFDLSRINSKARKEVLLNFESQFKENASKRNQYNSLLSGIELCLASFEEDNKVDCDWIRDEISKKYSSHLTSANVSCVIGNLILTLHNNYDCCSINKLTDCFKEIGLGSKRKLMADYSTIKNMPTDVIENKELILVDSKDIMFLLEKSNKKIPDKYSDIEEAINDLLVNIKNVETERNELWHNSDL